MISSITITGGNLEKELNTFSELPLKQIADTIKDDITRNLNESTGIDGAGLKPLSSKYKSFKQKYYGHSNIFWGKTGLLRKAVKVFKISKNEYHIKLNSNRAGIGMYHNEGMGNNPKREFFGVSKRINIDKTLNEWLKKI